MEESQNRAIDWFSSNRLLCNREKTQQITLNLNHCNDSQAVKLLGFQIDNKLNFQLHIDTICKKISRVNYLIWRLRDILDDNYLRTVYFSFFQSHISYGLLVWGHSHYVHNIFLLQKRIVRTMCRVGCFEHCRPLFKRLQVCTVYNLYIYHVLLYAKSNLDHFSYRQDIHSHNTRYKTRIEIPKHRLSKTSNSFKINAVTFFNRLPTSARTIPFQIFKKNIYEWLVNNPFYSIQEFLENKPSIQFIVA